ncbi:MAG: hypothetical protein H0W88_06220 [Parachlamydiaceae bacterium]|nr:hypothetical protein [Parachlamydiaceae bacterium]
MQPLNINQNNRHPAAEAPISTGTKIAYAIFILSGIGFLCYDKATNPECRIWQINEEIVTSDFAKIHKAATNAKILRDNHKSQLTKATDESSDATASLKKCKSAKKKQICSKENHDSQMADRQLKKSKKDFNVADFGFNETQNRYNDVVHQYQKHLSNRPFLCSGKR